MKPFSKKEKGYLFEDYKEVQSMVNKMLSPEYKYKNYFIINQYGYIKAPILLNSNCALDDEFGALMHHITIRDTLEKLLMGLPAGYTPHFRDAPVYIKKRLSKKKLAPTQ